MSGIIAQNAANATGLIKAAAGGPWTLLTTSTASASATVAFTSNIDSTYPIYLFEFNNMHPATNDVFFQFQGNVSGGSGFNETITSTHFRAYHFEDGSASGLAYRTANDQAQGTSYQRLSEDVYVAGYVNTTAAVTAVQFSMNSGNIDAGDICLYGIKDS